jgi:peptidoglycan/xylan/chitin deacetylase (PgdA/CDA1 family)
VRAGAVILLIVSFFLNSPARACEAVPVPTRSDLVARFGKELPREWGERVTGVRTRLDTEEKAVALTFDLCGGKTGSGLDGELLDFLEREGIPATVFVSHRWVEVNPAALARLAGNPLFEIANHGWAHRPASVTGRWACGIKGTGSVGEVYDEIERNAEDLASRTGKRPRFYRAGTAFSDEVAVKTANALGQEVAGFSVLGDAGATWPADRVRNALLSVRPGDIVLLHLNHPESGTRRGLMEAVSLLRANGFRFVGLATSLPR